MAKEVCVFCGKEAGYLRIDCVSCGPVSQWACKSCAKEVNALSEEERCRRALQLGIAVAADKIREYLELAGDAENIRPTCFRCDEKLVFRKPLVLCNVVGREGMLNENLNACPVVPAVCPKCGKLEFFDREHMGKDRKLAYLLKKDTEK